VFLIEVFMKKGLLLSVFSIALLSGCGQNVEELKADFLQSNPKAETVEFSGYVMVIDDEAYTKMREVAKSNDIPSHINVRGKEPLPPLPDVQFKNDEFQNVVNARKAIEDRTTALVAIAEQEIVNHKAGINNQIAEQREKLAEVNRQLAPFNTLIASEQTAYDTAHKGVSAVESKIAARDEEFFVKFKEVVIAEKMAIDTDDRIRPSRYYKHLNAKNCAKADQAKVKYMPDPKDGCISSKLSAEEAALEPLFRDYGVDMTLLYNELNLAKDVDVEAWKALLKAKIVAKNQTGINEDELKNQINGYNRKITSLTNRLDDPIDTDAVFFRVRSADAAFEQALKSYSVAAKDYELSLRKEALNQAGLSFEEFTDETANTSDNEGDDCFMVYVFTDQNDKQYVYTAKGNSRGNTKTFLQAYDTKAKFRELRFPIKNADDAMRAAVGYF
jgi:hypothetical protein